MRKNAAELGITYSPYPPYEVLQTREISTEELQIANNLSRTLDNYYNTSAWQNITRQLLINEADFLENFMQYLTELRVIDLWDWKDGAYSYMNFAKTIIRTISVK